MPINTHMKSHTHTKGFTIIETFIAVTLFALAVSATLTLVSKGIFFVNTSEDRITAVYLAQEGLEFIRNARTANLLAGQPWLAGLDACNSTNGCNIDTLANDGIATNVTACSTTCLPLYYNPTLYVYGYGSGSPWTATGYRRKVTVTPQINSDEILVTVAVTWTTKNVPYTVTFTDNLFNWN